MEIAFDIDKVISIEYHEMNKLNNYKWIEETPEIKAFWPWKRKKYKPAAFIDVFDYYPIPYSIKQLEKTGYLILPDTSNNSFPSKLIAYEKPIVKIYIQGIKEVYNRFNSNKEAKDWATNIQRLSGKNFITIKRP